MVNRNLMLIIALLAPYACTTHGANVEATPVATLAQCEAPAVDMTDWREATIPELGLKFRYPRSYEKQNPGVRHVPGISTDVWYRNGLRGNVLSVRMVDPLHADIDLAKWTGAPDYRECTETDAANAKPARIVFLTSNGLADSYGQAYGPYNVIAEWRFSGSRVVRLVGTGSDSVARREQFAIASTARFIAPPRSPVH